MHYFIEYSIDNVNRDAAQARFQETGGLPPDGVNMLGRWHRLAGLGGYVIAESDDPVAIGKWTQEWTDVLTFEITPVGTDEETLQVLGG